MNEERRVEKRHGAVVIGHGRSVAGSREKGVSSGESRVSCSRRQHRARKEGVQMISAIGEIRASGGGFSKDDVL